MCPSGSLIRNAMNIVLDSGKLHAFHDRSAIQVLLIGTETMAASVKFVPLGWKSATVHPDYHVEVDRTFFSMPHTLIGQRVDVRPTHRVAEVFRDHKRIASHVRRSH